MKICLIDGSSFLYRAFYAIKPLSSPDGKQVQAVFGFFKMLKKIITTIKPDGLIIAWDSKGKTVRHEIYPEYKATRMAPPSDLIDQKQIILEILTVMQICQIEKTGIEADDLIASVVDSLKNDHELLIISSDKDLGQLLEKSVKIYDPFKDETITTESFLEKNNFKVESLALYHALLGDSSDNIPGVKGIGAKTASLIAAQFNNLDELYNNISKAGTQRIQSLLVESKDNAYLSYDLFLLRNFKLDLNIEQIIFTESLWEKAFEYFSKLGFKSLLPENFIMAQIKKIPSVLDQGYLFKAITELNELEKVILKIKEKKHFAIDTETTGLTNNNNQLVGLSLCFTEGSAYYLPLDNQSNIDKNSLKKILDDILLDQTITKYLHNAKFDLAVLRKAGYEVNGIGADTMIAANLINTPGNKRGLKDLSIIYLNEQMQSFKEVVLDQNYQDFSEVPLDQATAYAAADAHQTFRLVNTLHNELKNIDLWDLYVNIELPLVSLLFEMEDKGILLDCFLLKEIEYKLEQEINIIFENFVNLSGVDKFFNINSPKQVGQLLFEKLGLKHQGKTKKTGNYSTGEEVLTSLAETHPVPKLLLKYRELFKLKSVYAQGLQKEIRKETSTIHTNYNQIAVATGRLSSLDPNLQNIPISNNEFGLGIRKAFKAREGFVFISADYSQIELRVLAFLSKDESLLNAFINEKDIHTETAAKLFNTDLNNINSEQRQIGKRINFSILYGLTAYGLAKDLKISTKDASIYIETYFKQYPGVKSWMDVIIENTKKTGFVETLLGRRRYFPEILEKNKILFEMAKRSAINTVAQGTAAEIVKKGMLDLAKTIKAKKIDANILLQIHDELLIEVAETQAEEMQKILKNVLESVVNWPLPLRVSIMQGKNWADVS